MVYKTVPGSQTLMRLYTSDVGFRCNLDVTAAFMTRLALLSSKSWVSLQLHTIRDTVLKHRHRRERESQRQVAVNTQTLSISYYKKHEDRVCV